MLSIPELVRFLVFVVFLVFFLLVCPVFLYWFRRNSRELLSKRPSFLGFPEDGRAGREQPPARID
jgi:hypothetical protein